MILYFTGTGNSRYIAELIAGITGDKLVSLNARIKANDTSPIQSEKPFVIVCPVYVGRIPRIVEEHIRRTSLEGTKQVYFVVACAETPWVTVRYAQRLCTEKGLELVGFNSVVMPQGYVVLGGTKSAEENEETVRKATPKIKQIAEQIKAAAPLPAEVPGKSFMSVLLNPIMYFAMISAKKFKATAACTQCGVCVEYCPLNNIQIENGKPVWGKNCTHCMACIGGCPEQAIEFGNKTRGRQRYYRLPNSM